MQQDPRFKPRLCIDQRLERSPTAQRLLARAKRLGRGYVPAYEAIRSYCRPHQVTSQNWRGLMGVLVREKCSRKSTCSEDAQALWAELNA